MKNKLEFKTKRISLDRKDIQNKFVLYSTKRKIRQSQVKNLVNVLVRGEAFPPIAVNKRSDEDRFYILDGNHRYFALQQFFDLYPDSRVEVEFNIYNIENAEAEKEKFLELNKIVKPSSDDILQQHTEDNEWFAELLDTVEGVSVYGSKKKPLKARVLLTAYIYARESKFAPRVLNPENIVKYMESDFDMRDISEIENFINLYQDTFGFLHPKSDALKTTVFSILMRIWYQNKDKFDYHSMIKKFRSLMTHHIFKEATQYGGIGAIKEYAPKFVDVLNTNNKKKFYVLEN